MTTSDNQLPVTKRVRYFNGQFLKSQDFIDEQNYHIDHQRRPYQFLHVSGICYGLKVVKHQTNQKLVTVQQGTALDAQGRLIVLEQQMDVKESDFQAFKGKTVKIYISYDEQQTDITQQGNDESGASALQGVRGATRWSEKPKIEVREGDEPNAIWLATVTLDAEGKVVTDPEDKRQYSGVRLPSGDGTGPVLRYKNGSAELTGSLSVSGIFVQELSVAKVKLPNTATNWVSEFSTTLKGDNTSVPTGLAVKTFADNNYALKAGNPLQNFSVQELSVAKVKLPNTATNWVSEFSTTLKEDNTSVPTGLAVKTFADLKYALKAGNPTQNFSVSELLIAKVKLPSNAENWVSEFSPTLKEDNTSVPTGLAVKTYVERKIEELKREMKSGEMEINVKIIRAETVALTGDLGDIWKIKALRVYEDYHVKDSEELVFIKNDNWGPSIKMRRVGNTTIINVKDWEGGGPRWKELVSR